MIRRDIQIEGREEWLLISQQEHAALAGDLASRWIREPFAGWPWREELLAAIYRHDDGWKDWDAAPAVSPATGAPLDFLETPLADALPIWRDSIAVTEEIGVLAAWVVSGHFSALLRRGIASRPDNAARKLGEAFLAEQDAHRVGWFRDWHEADPEFRTVEAAEQSLRYLQMFDAISLWLCCAERSAAESWQAPGGVSLTLTPNSRTRFLVRSWVFEPPPVHIQASGRVLPARKYRDAEEAAAGSTRLSTLAWDLVPAADA